MNQVGVAELNDMGIKLMSQGKTNLAVEMWQECYSLDRYFSTAILNIYSVYKQQGNNQLAREWLIKFLNCPLNAFTLDLVPALKNDLIELEKKLGLIKEAPQPVPQPEKK